ncbi:MAG: fasciclin domain-containing protein [Phycisphaerales bacterium]|nr:MAG: fasciclin domain-containing protein [Phycisphaerales bacterium]
MSDRSEGRNIVETAIGAGQFNTLATALEAAGLVDALQGDGPFTVFAPTDEAFDKLPEGTLDELLKPESRDTLRLILTYHVVSGKVKAADVVGLNAADTLSGQRISIAVNDGTVRLNDSARVTDVDIEASNGVIHIIDSVIMPNTKDILETAADAGDFSTLAGAIRAAGLVSTLQSDGPFTVFAPTDEAFAKVPAETLNSLMQPENRDQLIAVLTYHVVAGRVYADQAKKAGRAETVQGGTLTIRERDGDVRINNAKVLKADIDTTNGVIHVIDTVLIPE